MNSDPPQDSASPPDIESWGRRVKMQHLRVVLAAAETASLAQAGDRIGLTQPAITKIIQEVETGLGVELFKRTNRGTVCTEQGQLLADRLRLVFSQLDQAVKSLHDSREGLTGRVVVGALIAGAATLLPTAVSKLLESRPGIRVTVIEGTYDYLVPLLHRGALDFIIGRLPKYEYRDGLEVTPLRQSDVALVVRPGHPLLAGPALTLATLQGWPWILPLPGTTLRHLIEAAFHDHCLDMPQKGCESVSVVMNRALILQSDCIGSFPQEVIQFEIDHGLIRRLDIGQTLTFGPVGISRRKGVVPSNAAQALLNALDGLTVLAPD